LRLFSFGGYGLALAALALVVFGAYDSYPISKTGFVLPKESTFSFFLGEECKRELRGKSSNTERRVERVFILEKTFCSWKRRNLFREKDVRKGHPEFFPVSPTQERSFLFSEAVKMSVLKMCRIPCL